MENSIQKQNQTPLDASERLDAEQSVNASNGFYAVRKDKRGKIRMQPMQIEVVYEPDEEIIDKTLSKKAKKNALQKRNFPELFLKDASKDPQPSTSRDELRLNSVDDDFEVVFDKEEKVAEKEVKPKPVKQVKVDLLKQHLLSCARVAVKSQRPRFTAAGKPLPMFTVESQVKHWQEHIVTNQPSFKQKCKECGSIKGVDGKGTVHHIHTCTVSNCKTVYCHQHNMSVGDHRQYLWQCPNALQHTSQPPKVEKNFVKKFDPIALVERQEEICKTLHIVAKAKVVEDLDFSSIVGDNKDAVIIHSAPVESSPIVPAPSKPSAKKEVSDKPAEKKEPLPDVKLIYINPNCNKGSLVPGMVFEYPPADKQTKSTGKIFKVHPGPEPKQPTAWKWKHSKWSAKDWASSPITEVGKWFTTILYGDYFDSSPPVSEKKATPPAPRGVVLQPKEKITSPKPREVISLPESSTVSLPSREIGPQPKVMKIFFGPPPSPPSRGARRVLDPVAKQDCVVELSETKETTTMFAMDVQVVPVVVIPSQQADIVHVSESCVSISEPIDFDLLIPDAPRVNYQVDIPRRPVVNESANSNEITVLVDSFSQMFDTFNNIPNLTTESRLIIESMRIFLSQISRLTGSVMPVTVNGVHSS